MVEFCLSRIPKKPESLSLFWLLKTEADAVFNLWTKEIITTVVKVIFGILLRKRYFAMFVEFISTENL